MANNNQNITDWVEVPVKKEVINDWVPVTPAVSLSPIEQKQKEVKQKADEIKKSQVDDWSGYSTTEVNPNTIYKSTQRQLDIDDNTLSQEAEYGMNRSTASNTQKVVDGVNTSLSIIKDGNAEEINLDLESKISAINKEKAAIKANYNIKSSQVNEENRTGGVSGTEQKELLQEQYDQQIQALDKEYFDLKAIYIKDASAKFDPFYGNLKDSLGNIKGMQSFNDKQLDELLFQFGADVSFMGESNAKLNYENAYQKTLQEGDGLPKESIQAITKRGNILAIGNLSKLANEKSKELETKVQEIRDKYGLVEKDGKLLVAAGTTISQQEIDNYKAEMKALEPEYENIKGVSGFITKLSDKVKNGYKELNHRENLQVIADEQWKNQGFLDGVGYAIKENADAKLTQWLSTKLLINKFREDEAASDVISLEKYKYNQPILPTDMKTTQVFQFEDGKIKFGDLKHAGYNIAKVSAESLEIAALAYLTGGTSLEAQAGLSSAKGVLAGIGSRASIVLSTMALTSGDMIFAEYEKGLSPELATKTGLLKSFFEGVTEIVNLIEVTGLDKLKSFSKLGSKIGKEISEEAYTKVVNNVAKGLIGRVLSKETTQVLLGYGKEVIKAGAMETVEEEIGLLLNSLKDAKTKEQHPGYEGEEFNLESIISTAINTMVSSVGLGVFQATAERSNILDSYKYEVASNPNPYLDRLEKDLKNNSFSPLQYEAAKSKIEQLSTIHSANKTIIDNLQDEEQVEFVSLNEKSQELVKKMSGATEKSLEKLAPQLEKTQRQIASYTQKALAHAAKSPIEKQEFVENQLIDNINTFYNDAFIEKLQEKDIEQVNKDLLKKLFYMPTDKVKASVDIILDKITEKFKPKPVETVETTIEPTQLFEKLKTNIETFTKEDVEKELETALTKEGLSEIEQEEYYNLLSSKLDNLEKEQNLVTFKAKGEKTFTLGELVTYQGANYIVKKDEEGNPYLENDITKAKVVPSDVNDFTKYTPKTTNTPDVNDEEGEDPGKVWGIERHTLEDKKADIEKRRQEELARPVVGNKEAVQNSINERYDAELAALEPVKEEKPKTEEELREELNKLEERLTSVTMEDLPITATEYEALILKVKELRTLLGVKPPVEDTTEKDKKEEQEKTNKIAESKLQKVYYPFSTAPQQSTSSGVANEPFIQAQANTLQKIREKAETKSFEEQGIYVTVMNNNFPVDERHQQDNVINAYKAGQLTNARIKAGRIAVLTSKEGNPLFFDIEGNPSTPEKGYLVYQPLRGRLEGGKLDMSKQNIPTQAELKESGELERFNKDMEKLTNVRLSTESITFKIAEVSKGVAKIEDAPLTKMNFATHSLRVDSKGIATAIDNITQEVFPIYRENLQQAGLSDFVEAFMDMNNKEGLPEELQNSWLNRRDLLEKIVYTSSSTRRFKFDKVSTIFITSSENIETLPINVDVRLQNYPLNIFTWNGKSFTPLNYTTYQEFLAEHLNTRLGKISRFNSYIKLGDPVIKDVKPVEETPKTETKETPTKEFKKSERSKGIKINKDNKGLGGLGNKNELKRVKLLGKKVTEAQNTQAKQWFDTYLSNSGAKFEDLRAIVNSDAYATWSTAAIKLWQGGDFTDLYHEAFHDFTQLFLTKEQKQALYSEIRKDKPQLSDFAIEELLAEDFRKYMLSGQTLILNNRVKRNSTFRKIYNFLKELFTGTPSLEVIYQKLATGNISKSKRNLDNALFGILNKNVEGLTFNESINLYRALDSLIAKQFREYGYSISQLFKDKKYIEGAYQQVALDLDANLKGFEDSETKEWIKGTEEKYNDLVEIYNNSNDLRKQEILPELTQLQTLLDNTLFVLSNFDEVRAKHLQESEFLKISKKFVPDEIIDELEPNTKDSIYDDKETQSAKDRTSDQLIYLLATLPKYINQGGQKVEKWNDYLSNIEDITEFDLAWNRLAKALTGERDYKTMIDKIIKLTETNPEYQALLEALPNPNVNGAELSLLEMQLRNQFINTFSQPYIPLKFINWWKDKSNGQLRISTKEAIGRSYSLLEADWDENIQSTPNPYRILDSTTGQQYVDMEAIAKDFKDLNKLRPKRKEEFLQALGFSFSPQTLESPEYLSLITDNLALGKIHTAISKFVDFKNGILPKGVELTDNQIEEFNKPVVSLIKAIERTTYIKDKASLERNAGQKALIEGQKENIEFIQSIEIQYSDKYFSDNVLNSENSNVWAIRPWSQQSVLYNYLNNPKFQTYQQLINDPIGAYFDIKKNPDADNIYLNSVFDLSTGNRRVDRITKEPVKISLYNHNGLSINFGEDTKGSKTTSLTRFEKLVQDIAPLLLSGNKEHIRYGDKTTSNGTETTFYKTQGGNENRYLPVDIKDFRETFLPLEAQAIFRKILHSALLQTNQYFTQDVNKNSDNFNKNLEKGEYWGYFDGILSKETKDAILLGEGLLEEPIDVYTVIDKHWNNIALDLHDFLKADVKAVQKELAANNIVSIADYIPNDLLLKSQYGENNTERYETLIRAFAINSYILNLEHTRLVFQDPRFYQNKGNYKEPFKRYSKASSTGTIGINDDQQNEFLQNTRLEKKQYDTQNPDNKSPNWIETGVENTAIFDDVKMKAEDFLAEVNKIYKGKPKEEQLAVAKAYGDITTTDAFGFCTFDWYRIWQVRTGNDNWNNEKEELYKKIVTKQPISEDENLKAFLFFPPLKIRVVGQTFDSKTNKFIPIDYKFAVSPLLPQVVKGKAFEAVKDNMLRQNISIGLFKSGSKHSAITNNGNNNKFYNTDGTVNTNDYTINPIFTEYIFEVVPSPTDYKEEVSFSTQLRKLLFVNQFNKGYPVDYKEKDWDNLSQEERLKASKIYRLEQEFGNTINTLVSNEKEKLLKQLDATTDSKGNFIINEQKLSNLLEDEFNKRGLPYNVLKSVQTIDGKFKYALDASLQRETIEQVLLSIVDNKLRKQKGLGESLIQASSIGYESITFNRVETWNSINGNDLPFYQHNEGKPTSAQKVKIALQGDFKKLLNLPQIKILSEKENITPLEALNQLLKENEFSSTIKDLITITGVRIPVQGHNSMEFMEVGEFLPEEAGSVIIVSPALVAKSGGDFDWDKITSLYTSFNITESGTIHDYSTNNEKALKKAYYDLKKEFEERITNTPDFYNSLIQSIFGINPQELQEELLSEDIFQNKTIPSLPQFIRLSTKKHLNNKLNSIIRQVLEQPEMFEQLVTPNSTYLFEDIADARQEAERKQLGLPKPSYSDIPKVQESLNQFESNTVGKQSLGIGAIWNTLFAQMQKAGVTLEKTYITNITGKKPTTKFTANRLPHNKTKEGNISVSGLYSQPYNESKFLISESISQLMNGWVDVAKKDWVFYINGRKEVAPTLLYAATTGIHKDILIGFFNQPVIYDFVKNYQKYRSNITKFKNSELTAKAKRNAIFDTLYEYFPEKTKHTSKQQLKDLHALSGKDEWKFWALISGELRAIADDNLEAFNPEAFMKFAIPNAKGELEKPTSEQEKLNQALYLIQFLEFQEQGGIVEKLRRVVNQDTEKPVNIQYSKERQVRRAELKEYNLIPEHYIEKMANESVIKAFTHSKTGLDKFIQNLTDQTFEVTNHPIFNRFLYEEFNKPTEKNNIPFQIKFDIYEDWVKAVKNQFTEYLYQNYVYFPNTTEKVATKYFKEWTKPSTALALRLENLKKEHPELLENNLLLQFLIRDNSREKLGGKPKIVNLKLRKDRIDNTTSNALTEAFEQLYNSPIPEVNQFAKDLAHFAFVQSGLSKSPISFSNIIPQEYYGGDISDVIHAFHTLLDESPNTAKTQLERFYNDFFKKYNRKFFISNQVVNEETNQLESDIDFQKETFRGKDYTDSKAYDLLSKKQNIVIKKQQDFLESIKEKSSISPIPFTETTAKDNPNNFYIYEFNESGGGKLGSSKVRVSSETNTAPLILMKQARVEGGNWTDDTYAKNINIINSSISEAIAKIQKLQSASIIFPPNITEFSKLKQFAPLTYSYLVEKLKSDFNIQLEGFEEVKNVEEKTESGDFSLPSSNINTETEEVTTSLSGGEQPITPKEEIQNTKIEGEVGKEGELLNKVGDEILETSKLKYKTIELKGVIEKIDKTEQGYEVTLKFKGYSGSIRKRVIIENGKVVKSISKSPLKSGEFIESTKSSYNFKFSEQQNKPEEDNKEELPPLDPCE